MNRGRWFMLNSRKHPKAARGLFRGRSARRVLGRARRAGFRPGLDSMEDRTLLSTWAVLNGNDAGPGSLRQAIVDAQDGDTIEFDAALAGSTIVLGDSLVIDESLQI